MTSPPTLAATFELAREVAEILEREGLEPLLIGALALAVHHYPRQTEDLDLAIAVAPRELERLADVLRARGLEVELHLPDAADPLGGVLTCRRPGAFPVEIVNFDNAPAGGFPALVRDAAPRAELVGEELPLRVVSVVDLILFKLYAGGPKSRSDILELLVRNAVDWDALRARAESYRMGPSLEALLAELPESDEER